MNFISTRRNAPALLLLGATLAVSPTRMSLAQTAPIAIGASRIPVAESVPTVLKRATLLKHLDPQQKFSAMVGLNFRDPQAAEAFAYAVSDPRSPIYGQFITPQEVGERFGPDPADYEAAKAFGAANGLRVTQEYPNRLTITLEGTVSQFEKAFGTTINEYRESQADFIKRPNHGAAPMEFFSNATPILVPAEFAHAVTGVHGLSNYMRPIPRFKKLKKSTTGPMSPQMVQGGYNVTAMQTIGGNYGSGRTVAISNFDGENHATNAPDFIKKFSLPTPSGGSGSNITVTTIGGGNGTSGGGEGDLDYQMVLGMAPLATIIIYDSGGSSPLLPCLQKESSDNLADVLSESYGWQISGSTATSYHNVHVTMVMQGQTYGAASGDSGSSISPYWYPDIDPDILMVGGSAMTVSGTTAPITWVSETVWNDSAGAGGGGHDTTGTYAQPSYQVGRGIGTIGGRGFPDISAEAGTDGSNYAMYFYYSGSETEADGTSCASPMNAGAIAVTEEYLISIGKLAANSAGKYRLGLLNTALYAFNGRNDVFHDITTGNNGSESATKYWDQASGWGSLNYYNLAAALANPLAVAVTPQGPTINYGQTVQCAAAVTGSNVQTVTWSLVSGPTGSSVSSAGLFTAPATGTVTTTAVVQAAWTGDYAAPGASAASTLGGTTTITIAPLVATSTVSGTITLQGAVSETGQTVTFNLVPTVGTTVTQMVTLPASGAYTLTAVPAGTYTLKVKGPNGSRRM